MNFFIYVALFIRDSITLKFIMKKLILSIAVLAVMASCSEKQAEDKGSEIKAKIENCTDPDSMRIYVREAQEYADKLVKEGKNDAADAFMQEVVPAVKAKDPAAASFAELKAKEAVDSLSEAAKNKAKEVSDSVSAKVGEAKDAVKDAADKANEKTSDAANAATEKAANAVQQGADKLKDALTK